MRNRETIGRDRDMAITLSAVRLSGNGVDAVRDTLTKLSLCIDGLDQECHELALQLTGLYTLALQYRAGLDACAVFARQHVGKFFP